MKNSEVRQRKFGKKKATETESTTKQEKPQRSICWLIFCVIVSTVLVLLLIGYINSPVKAVAIKDYVHVPLTGKFSINYKLTKGKRVPLTGPESIAEGGDGKLYTGLADGRVVCIHPSNDGEIGAGKVENITTGVIEGAFAIYNNAGHGRPLGVLVKGNTLYVMDAVYGFYGIDLSTKKITLLVTPNAVEPAMKFPDDLTITADGKTVYFTDLAVYPMSKMGYSVFSGLCSGRVIKYDIPTKKVTVVLKDLCGANGIQLTKDDKSVIVCEINHYRCKWFDVKTWEEIRVLNLPVMPDNVRMSNHETYWITGGHVNKLPTFLSTISQKVPFFRQSLLGLLTPDLQMMVFLYTTNTNLNMLIEVNDKAEVIQVLQDPEAQLCLGLSQATHLSDERIALGSFFGPYLTILDKPDM
nr:adipocyte plasma membrane-associated protein [Ciona intestinalis]|eukprot:XP_009857530.1 adipocyte plasma membrane-associated protein [Ciona intestinalis]